MFLIDRSSNSIIVYNRTVRSVVFQFVEGKKLINREGITQNYFSMRVYLTKEVNKLF